jgi:hypothetical protein
VQEDDRRALASLPDGTHTVVAARAQGDPGKGAEPVLVRPPVVAVGPVGDEIGQVCGVGASLPRCWSREWHPVGRREAATEVVEHGVVDAVRGCRHAASLTESTDNDTWTRGQKRGSGAAA